MEDLTVEDIKGFAGVTLGVVQCVEDASGLFLNKKIDHVSERDARAARLCVCVCVCVCERERERDRERERERKREREREREGWCFLVIKLPNPYTFVCFLIARPNFENSLSKITSSCL